MVLNRKAALLSGLVCPGLGQLYRKQTRKGAAIVISITIILGALFVRIFLLTWKTAAVIGPFGLEGVRLDPATLATLNHQAWVRNWWLLVIFIALWLYSIIDALVSSSSPAAK
jgi:hypothetical protein